MSLKSAHNYNLKSDGVLSTYTDIPTSSVIYFCLAIVSFCILKVTEACLMIGDIVIIKTNEV